MTHFFVPFAYLPSLTNKQICIAASPTDAVNHNGIKTLLANGLSTFSIIGNPVISNGPKSPLKNPPECPILCN